MNIVSVCIHYPSPENPTRGIFVQRRLEAMAKYASVRVVSPQPWFPFVRPYRSQDSLQEGQLPVYRPRMPYLPRFGKRFDGDWLARCLRPVLKQLHDEQPIDLVDAHFEFPEGVGAVAAANRLGVPSFVTLRGLLTKSLKSPSKRGSILESLQSATGVISVSESLRRLAVENNVNASKIAVIPNGIDGSTFYFDHEANRESGSLIVAVGHLMPVKGYAILVEAFSKLRLVRPDARLKIIGRTDCNPAFTRTIRKIISDHALGEYCELAGECEPKEIAATLSKAAVFCLPSFHEGCCNSVLEALACGTPVVTTPVGDNEAYVQNGVNGRLAAVGDANELADALDATLDADWDRKEIARAMKRSWDTVGKEVVEYLGRALRSSSASTHDQLEIPCNL